MSRRAIGLIPMGLLLLAVACSDNKGTTPPPPEQKPRPASGLYAYRTAPTLIRIRWRDNSEIETGFRIERKTSEAAFAQLDTVEANVTSYDDQSVTDGTQYQYRILSYRFEALADPSNEISVLATAKEPPSPPASPEPPDGLLDWPETDPVQLSWFGHDPQGATLTYDVYFGATFSEMQLLSSAQSDTSYLISGPFERNSNYFWRVIAHDATGVSVPSAIWTFSTEVDRDSVPTGYFVMGDTLEFLHNDPEQPNPAWHPGNPIECDGFNIDRYVVTNQQYASFLNQEMNRDEIWLNADQVHNAGRNQLWMVLSPTDPDNDIYFSVADSAFLVDSGRDLFPVVQVTWYGADAYAQFYHRRLPREREWEKAARGTNEDLLGIRQFELPGDTVIIGLGYPYPWGEWTPGQDLSRGNFVDSGDPYENLGRVRTTPVGFYDGDSHNGYQTRDGRSIYGVTDMSGNVWELSLIHI